MLDQKTFNVDTTAIAAQLLLQMSRMGISASLQSVGSFMDASRSEIAKVSAHYYLARISNGRSMSMDGVYVQINELVTKHMCRHIPSMTGKQIEMARTAILQTIASVYTQQYSSNPGLWDMCRLVSLTPSEFVINATRQREVDTAANAEVGAFRQYAGSYGEPARRVVGGH